jgi:hypothetical protein
VAKLPLHLFSGNTFIRGTYQVHYNKPHQEWKIGVFQNRSTSESSSGSTLCTLKLLNALHPIVFSVLTFSALYANFEAVIPKRIPTGLLIRVMLNKLYMFHNHQFETKLELVTVTNLRSGY